MVANLAIHYCKLGGGLQSSISLSFPTNTQSLTKKNRIWGIFIDETTKLFTLLLECDFVPDAKQAEGEVRDLETFSRSLADVHLKGFRSGASSWSEMVCSSPRTTKLSIGMR